MARRRSRSRSRSSSRGSFSRPLSLARPAIVGGAGALVINGAMNYAPIPDTLKSGNLIYITRAALAVLLGLFGPRLPFVGPYAREMAIGSLIVTATDFGKVLALQHAGVNLSGLGYTGPAQVMRLNGLRGNKGMGMLVRGPGARMPVAAPNVSGLSKLLHVR